MLKKFQLIALFMLGALALFANDKSNYNIAVIGDVHFDDWKYHDTSKIKHLGVPQSKYVYNKDGYYSWRNHSLWTEINLGGSLEKNTPLNIKMWEKHLPGLLDQAAAAARKAEVEYTFQLGDMIHGDCYELNLHKSNLTDSLQQLTSRFGKTLVVSGNHDTRGIYAENFADYTPTDRGRTYYTFRTGNVWGMVLDCGEDKPDTHDAYGHTICFHQFRLRETQFIKDVIRRAAEEYDAPDVKHKLVICHIPFSCIMRSPFDIEQELYGEWCSLLREHIKPELLLFGHLHGTKILPIGCELDHQGQPCPAIIGSCPFTPNQDRPEEHFHGCAVALNSDGIRVVFNTDSGEILEDTTLES